MEADLAVVVVEADDPRSLAHELLDIRVRTPARPVRLLGEVPVHRWEVDTRAVVVQLKAAFNFALHAESVRRRKPPCSS